MAPVAGAAARASRPDCRNSRKSIQRYRRDKPELLARHCAEAGLIEKAAGLWGKAGQRSAPRSALVEAADQIKRALDPIATLPASRSPPARANQAPGRVYHSAPPRPRFCRGGDQGRRRAGAPADRKAEALGEPPEDPLLLFSVLYGFWAANFVAFNGEVVRDLAEQFLALAEKERETVPLNLGHRLMGVSLLIPATSREHGRISIARSHFTTPPRIVRSRRALQRTSGWRFYFFTRWPVVAWLS